MIKYTLLFLTISLTAIAQVPQGVGYQGVATDANGIELINQSISIRASVLSGSATGTIEWQETHATTTDTFGLFTLTIGQGAPTGNGVQGNFADISWGTNTHFLKIEMDVTGGSNYSFMGTNQMMSVPYALYAESANINYDSITNILSNDSTFITNIGSGTGGGCDILFPEGFNGEAITDFCGFTNPYTVPNDMRLYVISSGSNQVRIDNSINTGFSFSNISGGKPIILNEGEILSSTASLDYFNGLLVNKKSDIQAITDFCGINNPYTVPNGKKLFVMLTGSNNISIDNSINSGFSFNYIPTAKPFILQEGEILKSLSSQDWFNGYLVDENYFANCGGAGSSSTSINYDSIVNILSTDSTFISNIGGSSSGCNFKHPEGYDGEAISVAVNNSNLYTVPVGKRLYITNSYGNGTYLNISGVGNISYEANHAHHHSLSMPIILNAGEQIQSSNGNWITINGYLVDETPTVQGISLAVNNSNLYTVPIGKRLYITNNYGNGTYLNISGVGNISYETNHNTSHSLSMPIILNTGEQIQSSNGNWVTINGYLVDENYFADCGGGSSNTPNNFPSIIYTIDGF